MNWQAAERSSDGALKVPDNWLFPHYYEALTVLFRVENALRLFVYVILKDHYGPKWQDLEISSDEEAKTTIAALAKRRIVQGNTFGYLSCPTQSPLMHLTSGELVRLIAHDSYWPAFKDYFPAAKNVVTLKLQEIGIIRNAIAHFRPVSSDDVEVAKQNANQMLSKVEHTLTGLIQCAQTVPTNTKEDWYLQLRTLGTDAVSLRFSQSSDGSWVRIALVHRVTVISGSPDTKSIWQHYRIACVTTPALFDVSQVLRRRAILLTERIRRLRLGKDLCPLGEKEVCLTFSRRVLAEAHAELKAALEEALTLIIQETDLLKEDQLAQGSLMQLRWLVARQVGSGDSSYWSIDESALSSPPPDEALPEYWGHVTAGSNFISDTESYPWIPVKVSEEDVPF